MARMAPAIEIDSRRKRRVSTRARKPGAYHLV
jgi:hypothetical protein